MRTFEQSSKSSKTVKSMMKSEGTWGAMPDEAESTGVKKKRKGKRGGAKGRSDTSALNNSHAANHSSSDAEEGESGLGSSGREASTAKPPAAPSVAPSNSGTGAGTGSGEAAPKDDSDSTPPELLKQSAPRAPLSQEEIQKRLLAKYAGASKKKGYSFQYYSIHCIKKIFGNFIFEKILYILKEYKKLIK